MVLANCQMVLANCQMVMPVPVGGMIGFERYSGNPSNTVLFAIRIAGATALQFL
jgi:hypothetical protein